MNNDLNSVESSDEDMSMCTDATYLLIVYTPSNFIQLLIHFELNPKSYGSTLAVIAKEARHVTPKERNADHQDHC